MAYHQYEKSRIFFGKMSDLKGYRFKILQRKLVKETGTQEWKLTTQLWLLHKVGGRETLQIFNDFWSRCIAIELTLSKFL